MSVPQGSNDTVSYRCMEHNTASHDALTVEVPPSQQYPAGWMSISQHPLGDLPVFRSTHQAYDSASPVDVIGTDSGLPWIPFETQGHTGLNGSPEFFDNLGLWQEDPQMDTMSHHEIVYSDRDSAGISEGSLFADSILLEPSYSVSAPMPRCNWEFPWSQCSSFDQIANTVPVSIHSISDETLSTSTRSRASRSRLAACNESIRRSSSTCKSERLRCPYPKCNKGFTLRKDLTRHIRAIHDHEKWACDFPSCSRATRGFSRKDKLIAHMKTHNKAEYEHLKARTSTQSSAANGDPGSLQHDAMKSKSGGLPDETGAEYEVSQNKEVKVEEAKSHVCSIPGCGRTFVNQHDLARHERTMHVEKNSNKGYRCAFEACSKRDKIWNRLDNFKKHVREQHAVHDVQTIVDMSTRMSIENHANAPFDITTPDHFLKRLQLR